jgi:hypothetical protein
MEKLENVKALTFEESPYQPDHIFQNFTELADVLLRE